MRGEAAHLVHLVRREADDGVGGVGAEPDRLHLDGEGGVTVTGQDVDLPTADEEVALEDAGAAAGEKGAGDVLAEGGEAATGKPGQIRQICEVGSSSSMFTSRKVITLTFFTKRAGRNISQTHASSNSSSK